MTDKIEPALTPEEWEFSRVGTFDLYVLGDGGVFPVGSAPNRHALAALALANQPFGFTWEDVAMLDSLDLYGDDARDPRYRAIDSLRDRIKALLPTSKP